MTKYRTTAINKLQLNRFYQLGRKLKTSKLFPNYYRRWLGLIPDDFNLNESTTREAT